MKLFKILIILFTLSIQSFSTNINRENTLVIAQEKDPRTFDPHFGNDGFSLRINRLIYSRLIEKDSNMKNIPGIAKSWNFINNQKIKFNIFNDIFFQNGENLTTKDIKFSFERMKNSPRISAILPPIKEIKIIDKYNFIMVLSKPF
ncbi:ABC transporter substrate-binding protein, partial [uncultured Cetobacterium sp.]|uniref:ABC transporter substrate-binding protein n=1 Tax=uncultured Cetobacterium sp. TaxID=527638 RepID=UPI00262D0BD7